MTPPKIGYTRGPYRKKPVIDRIMARVQVTESGCWEWTGARNALGYGKIGVRDDQGQNQNCYVHAVVWETRVGPLPSGLELDHLCRNPPCCNPDHLEPVTHQENLRRGGQARRLRIAVCRRGHPYGDPPKLDVRGQRVCLICKRVSSLDYYYRKRGTRRAEVQQ